MSLPNLQEIIAATPAGGTIDLGAGEYSDNLNPDAGQGVAIKKPLTITSDGAKVYVTKSKRRDRPGFLLASTAAGTSIRGRLDVIFPDERRNDHLEAQHGFRFDGVTDVKLDGTHCVNHQGDGFNFSPSDPKLKLPSQRIVLANTASINAGRAHYGLNAVVGIEIARPYMEECGRAHSAIVFEPNGVHDVCQDALIHDGWYTGHTGYCFSSSGLHPHMHDDNLSDVTLQGMRSKGAFTMYLGTGPDDRHGPFTADFCSGEGIMNTPQVRIFKGFHDVKITNFSSPTSCGSPFDIEDGPRTDVITTLLPVVTT